MHRREALTRLFGALAAPAVAPELRPAAGAALPVVSTLIGTGAPGYSAQQVNDPYGLVIGPDRALYFCDLGNQRIRRLDLRTRAVVTVAGDGAKAYAGDGGKATEASLSMPHEIQFDAAGHLYIAERDNHVIRRVAAGSGLISTLAGTGEAGFAGDGGPAARALLRQPHSIALEPGGRRLFICDVGNHRLRAVDLRSGTIATVGGTGERGATPDGGRLDRSPLHGPRTMAFDRRGHLYLALREGNAIHRVDAAGTIHHVAGTGAQGYGGDGGPAHLATLAGPKGLAWGRGGLYVVDTENHVIRRIDLRSGVITTVLGTGKRGDGPDGDPLRCALSRPHGVLVDARGAVYVGDSEAHRIRVVA